METYKDEFTLIMNYAALGSTWRVGDKFGVSNGTIIYWMRKFNIPRNPTLYFYYNNSGKGRLCELYIADFPYFKEHFKDVGKIDDKSPFDGYWFENKVNIKSSHYNGRKSFRIKRKKRHNVLYYICCVYEDDIDPLIPIAIYVIPAKFAPRSTITISSNPSSKYEKFRLKSGIDYDPKEAEKYNKVFKEMYLYFLNESRKRGEKHE